MSSSFLLPDCCPHEVNTTITSGNMKDNNPSQQQSSNHRMLHVCDKACCCFCQHLYKKISYASNRVHEKGAKYNLEDSGNDGSCSTRSSTNLNIRISRASEIRMAQHLNSHRQLVSQWLMAIITVLIVALFNYNNTNSNNAVQAIHTSSVSSKSSLTSSTQASAVGGLIHQIRPSFRSMLSSLHPNAVVSNNGGSKMVSAASKLAPFWLNPAAFLTSATSSSKQQQQGASTHDKQQQYAFNRFLANSFAGFGSSSMNPNQQPEQRPMLSQAQFSSIYKQPQSTISNSIWTSLDVDPPGSQASLPESLLMDASDQMEISSQQHPYLNHHHEDHSSQQQVSSPFLHPMRLPAKQTFNYLQHLTTIRPLITPTMFNHHNNNINDISPSFKSSPMDSLISNHNNNNNNSSRDSTRLVIKHPESCSYHRSQPACAFNLLCYLASGIPVEGCADQQINNGINNQNHSHETCCYIYPGGNGNSNNHSSSRAISVDNYNQLSQLVLKSSVSLAPATTEVTSSSSNSTTSTKNNSITSLANRENFFSDLINQTNPSLNINSISTGILENSLGNTTHDHFLSSESSLHHQRQHEHELVGLSSPSMTGTEGTSSLGGGSGLMTKLDSTNMDTITKPIVYPLGQSYSPTRRGHQHHHHQSRRTSRRFAPSSIGQSSYGVGSHLFPAAPQQSGSNQANGRQALSSSSSSLQHSGMNPSSHVQSHLTPGQLIAASNQQVENSTPTENQVPEASSRLNKYISDHTSRMDQMLKMKSKQQQQDAHQSILREDNAGDITIYSDQNSQNSILFNNILTNGGGISTMKPRQQQQQQNHQNQLGIFGSKQQLNGGGQQSGWVANDLRFLVAAAAGSQQNGTNSNRPIWPNQNYRLQQPNEPLFFHNTNSNIDATNNNNNNNNNGDASAAIARLSPHSDYTNRVDQFVGPVGSNIESTSLIPMKMMATAGTTAGPTDNNNSNNNLYMQKSPTNRRLHQQQVSPSLPSGYKVARQRSLNLTAAYPSLSALEPYSSASSSSSLILNNNNINKNNNHIQQQQSPNKYKLEQQQNSYFANLQALVDATNNLSSSLFLSNNNNNNNIISSSGSNNNINVSSNKNDNPSDQLITFSGLSTGAASTAMPYKHQTSQTPSYSASLNHSSSPSATNSVLFDSSLLIANSLMNTGSPSAAASSASSIISPSSASSASPMPHQRHDDSLFYQIVQGNQPNALIQQQHQQQLPAHEAQAAHSSSDSFKSVPQQLILPPTNNNQQQFYPQQQHNLHIGQQLKHLVFANDIIKQQSQSSLGTGHDHDMLSSTVEVGQPRSATSAASMQQVAVDHNQQRQQQQQHQHQNHNQNHHQHQHPGSSLMHQFNPLQLATSSTSAPSGQLQHQVSDIPSMSQKDAHQMSQASGQSTASTSTSTSSGSMQTIVGHDGATTTTSMHHPSKTASSAASSSSSSSVKHLAGGQSTNHDSNHNHGHNHNHNQHQHGNSNGAGTNIHHQSASSLSSSLSTVLDVFGAASQYLMRFRPTALISPTSSSSHGNNLKSLAISSSATTTSPVIPLPLSASSANLISSLHKSSSVSEQSGSLSKYNQYNQRREDVCGRTIQTPQRRIIGGEGARFGEFPYQVHIKIAKHQCGGALVDRQSIVTAAHCVYHFISRAPVSKLQIVIGAYDIEDEQYQELPPQYFKVNKVKLHPNFRFSASHPDRYDIAILKLDRPVKYTDNVLPVCLPPLNFKFESMIGTVTGFGKTDPSLSNRYGTRLLQKVDVPIIENAECERWHRTRGIDLKIFPEMMCAGYEDGLKDACVGDSGGPLVVKIPVGPNGQHRWTLAGITSAGFGCAQSRQPGIYHRVSHTVDWIIENLD